jgi:hypothetical protein
LAAAAALLLAALAAAGAEPTAPRDTLDLGWKNPNVGGLAFSRDGKMLAVFEGDVSRLVLWDVATKKKLAVLGPDDGRRASGPVRLHRRREGARALSRFV